MNAVPKKVEDRCVAGVRRFQSAINDAKLRNANETDTVAIIRDVLSEVLGFDKYSDIISELPIRGTFCDLAVKIEDKHQFIVEAKAIGTELRDGHLKQAVDYALHLGVKWVLVTNAIDWRVYKVIQTKSPVEEELILEIDFLSLDLKAEDHIESLYRLSKEGWQKQLLVDYAAERQALNKFLISQVVLSDPILDAIRREVRRVLPDVKVKSEQIKGVLEDEVLREELVEDCDKVDEAKRKVRRSAERSLRERDSEAPIATAAVVQATPALPAVSYVPSPQVMPPPIV